VVGGGPVQAEPYDHSFRSPAAEHRYATVAAMLPYLAFKTAWLAGSDLDVTIRA
jgi:hypothetical protein